MIGLSVTTLDKQSFDSEKFCSWHSYGGLPDESLACAELPSGQLVVVAGQRVPPVDLVQAEPRKLLLVH